MKIDEVLKSVREENSKGKARFIWLEGYRYGVMALFVITCILGVYNGIYGFENANRVVLAMFGTYLGAQSLGIYRITQKRIEIVKIVVGFLLGLGALASYIVQTSR
nr:DUF6442 family protein [Ohessyouella blattaphilus]